MKPEIKELIEETCRADAAIINLVFGQDKELGRTMLIKLMSDFEAALRQGEGPFVRGMNIRYRHYVVSLLKMIDERYRSEATSAALMN